MDADGTKEGFDLEMIRAVRKEVKIPIIASGGAGKVDTSRPPSKQVPTRCWLHPCSITAS